MVRRACSFLSSFCLTGALLLGLFAPPIAEAQERFQTTLSENGREILDSRDTMDGESMYAILVDEARLAYDGYEGEEPVEARFLVFFLGTEGEVRSLSSSSFEIDPSEVRQGTFLPGDQYLPEGQFLPRDQFLKIEGIDGDDWPRPQLLRPEPVEGSEVAFEFEDAWTLDYEQAWASALARRVDLEDGQAGVGFALVPLFDREHMETFSTQVQFAFILRG